MGQNLQKLEKYIASDVYNEIPATFSSFSFPSGKLSFVCDAVCSDDEDQFMYVLGFYGPESFSETNEYDDKYSISPVSNRIHVSDMELYQVNIESNMWKKLSNSPINWESWNGSNLTYQKMKSGEKRIIRFGGDQSGSSYFIYSISKDTWKKISISEFIEKGDKICKIDVMSYSTITTMNLPNNFENREFLVTHGYVSLKHQRGIYGHTSQFLMSDLKNLESFTVDLPQLRIEKKYHQKQFGKKNNLLHNGCFVGHYFYTFNQDRKVNNNNNNSCLALCRISVVFPSEEWEIVETKNDYPFQTGVYIGLNLSSFPTNPNFLFLWGGHLEETDFDGSMNAPNVYLRHYEVTHSYCHITTTEGIRKSRRNELRMFCLDLKNKVWLDDLMAVTNDFDDTSSKKYQLTRMIPCHCSFSGKSKKKKICVIGGLNRELKNFNRVDEKEILHVQGNYFVVDVSRVMMKKDLDLEERTRFILDRCLKSSEEEKKKSEQSIFLSHKFSKKIVIFGCDSNEICVPLSFLLM